MIDDILGALFCLVVKINFGDLKSLDFIYE